jgi:hypothetical protein
MYFKVSKVAQCRHFRLKLSFDIENLAFFGLETVLATFSPSLATFSGHPATI